MALPRGAIACWRRTRTRQPERARRLRTRPRHIGSTRGRATTVCKEAGVVSHPDGLFYGARRKRQVATVWSRAIVINTSSGKDHWHCTCRHCFQILTKLSCMASLLAAAFVQHTQTNPKSFAEDADHQLVKSRAVVAMRHGNQVFDLLSGPFAAGHSLHQNVFSALPGPKPNGTHYICQHKQLHRSSFVVPQSSAVFGQCVNRFAGRGLKKWMPMFTSYAAAQSWRV